MGYGMKRAKGYFIVFEGGEGSGKSTQIERAARYLKQKGFQVLVLREPGGTRISEAIRNLILNRSFREMTPETELLLYLASRAQVIREKIVPALRQGKVVICDRFEDSTLAYQGFGRNISLRVIETVSRRLVRGSLIPDLTVLLDISPRHGIQRGGRIDRMERQSLSFHQRVRRGYLVLARRQPKRYAVIDARQDQNTVARKIKERLNRVFGV
ncbi:MAG: dTMP kinase [Candidatus Omnitrophica bacterium]|nr:dTMP kinase [Candidatus Omnitrophota bacterium]